MTTPEASLHVVPSDNQSNNKEKNKKDELWKWSKRVKFTKQEEFQSNLNETVSPIEIFSLVTGLEDLLELIVEQSKPLRLSEWKQLHSYQGKNESIFRNKLLYCNLY